MLVLSLFAAAWADECPERVTPEQLAAQLEALEPDVFYAVEGTPERLAALEGLLDGCLDGPITAEGLTRLWIVRGISDHFFLGEIGPEGQLRLGSAMAVGGAEAWPEAFGEELQKTYLSSSAIAMGGATITLNFTDYDIVAVDGEIRYARGAWQTTPGLHLVQWRLQGQGPWFSALVQLERGGNASVGAAAPPEPIVDSPEPEETPKKQREAREPREPKEREPREPREPREGGANLGVHAALGYGLSTGQVVDSQGYPASGTESLPLATLRAQAYGATLWGGLELVGAPLTEGPGWPSSVALLSGGLLHPGKAQVLVAVGPLLTGSPQVEDLVLPEVIETDWTPDLPEFSLDPAFGGRAMAQLQLPELRLQPGVRLNLDLASGGLTVVGLEPSIGLPFKELTLSAGLPVSVLMNEQSRLVRAAGIVGVAWAR